MNGRYVSFMHISMHWLYQLHFISCCGLTILKLNSILIRCWRKYFLGATCRLSKAPRIWLQATYFCGNWNCQVWLLQVENLNTINYDIDSFNECCFLYHCVDMSTSPWTTFTCCWLQIEQVTLWRILRLYDYYPKVSTCYCWDFWHSNANCWL